MLNCRYSLRDGASFAEQAQGVTFDLTNDEGKQDRKRRELHWDKRKKKFTMGTGEGADNVKMVKTESGAKLPATYRSGRFDEWKAKSKTSIPRVGEEETQGPKGRGGFGPGGRRWKHNQVTAAKPLDKLGKNFERKTRQLLQKQKESGVDSKPAPAAKGKNKLGGRFGGKPVGRVKNELRTVDQIRKGRQQAERKKLKNARPSKKGRR